MNRLEYMWVKHYHQEMIRQVQLTRRGSSRKTPLWKDRFLLQLGDQIIVLGSKIRSMSCLREQRAYNKFSQECS